MKYLYILIVMITSLNSYSQKDVEILNDSFLIISYDKVNSIKERTENLKKQIEILSEYAIICDTATKKALTKESWYNQEIDKWSLMDSILREKIILSNSIIDNYKTLVIITEDQLKKANSTVKKEKFWKNVYKTPAIIGTIAFLSYIFLK